MSLVASTILLAIALSMDAFAVSLTLGIRSPNQVKKMALLAGLYFGVFQGVMPLIGYFGGVAVFGVLAGYTNFIAFLLLIIIGIKMIYEALTSDQQESLTSHAISHYTLFILAIATSIDALAAGFSLALLNVNGIYACVVIGVVTFAFSYVGVLIARKSASIIGNKAELLGGVVLVLLGIKILIF